MNPEKRIVDNRVFLLGLDELYREAMKKHEREELLRCAQDAATALGVVPADVPIEGYYSEDANLTAYFRLVRAMQREPREREGELRGHDSFQRLREVLESPLFGNPVDERFLFAAGVDPLSAALEKTFPEWNIEHLTSTAYESALSSDDFSLVALGTLSRDPVVLAALRESVVLYAAVMGGGVDFDEPEYLWQVDPVIEARAEQFVSMFNLLMSESLPKPRQESAESYWHAHDPWSSEGRCVRLGFDDSVLPIKHYHWAIDRDANYELVVRDFWDAEIWTTQRYREEKSL